MKNTKGFTLLELLLAVVIASLLLVGMQEHWVNLFRTLMGMKMRMEISREVRVGLEYLQKDLQTAVGVAAESDELTICQDGEGSWDGEAAWSSPDTVIRYYLSNNQLLREIVGGGDARIIVENLASFKIDTAEKDPVVMMQFSRGSETRSINIHIRHPYLK